MLDNNRKIEWPGWETVKVIGRGSFGTVYEIQRKVIDEVEKAALKVISIPQSDSDIDDLYSEGYDNESLSMVFDQHLHSIIREYSTMRKFSGCPNIVNCDDVRYTQHEDGIGWDIYIKMELLTPLGKAVSINVDEATVLKLGIDLCTALENCKRHNIVHRDIKPQNIFLSEYGSYKLGDFGIAKTIERTIGGTKIGSYDYMAPEIYNNQPYGSSADLYSLGLVLYWMLNERRLPFLPLPPEVPKVWMNEEARSRRFAGENIPMPKHGSDALKRVVLKACAFNERDRFSDATDMKRALMSILNGAGYFGTNVRRQDAPVIPPAPPAPPAPPVIMKSAAKEEKQPASKTKKKPAPKSKLIAIFAAVIVALIAIIVGISISGDSDDVGLNLSTGEVTVTEPTVSAASEVTSTTEATTEETTTAEETTEETTTAEETTTEKETTTKKEPSTKDEKDKANYRPVKETVYATETVNVRSSASTSSSKLGKLSKGKSVTRIGIGDNGWSKVTYNGKTGYVASEYLTKTKPTTARPTTTTTKPTTTTTRPTTTTTRPTTTTTRPTTKPSPIATSFSVVYYTYDETSNRIIVEVNPSNFGGYITGHGNATVSVNSGYSKQVACYISGVEGGYQTLIIDTSKLPVSEGDIIRFTIPANTFRSVSGDRYNMTYSSSVTY